jgi:hypothetical protein
MGGALLKTWNLPKKRISASEYEQIKTELLKKLNADLRIDKPVNILAAVAPSLRKKETHGDLDICVADYGSEYIPTWRKTYISFSEYIKGCFGYTPHKNSNVYSFPYKGFQIDVTIYPLHDFFSALNYNSWGDTSNLMGRIFHKMGLHYGHSGLSFWIRQGLFDNNTEWSDNDHIYEKVCLTKDMREICLMGGFDYDVWKNGFDSEEQAFDFIVDSEYFDSSLFFLQNLNHINRVRNAKRGMYMRFIEYVSGRNIKKKPFCSKQEYSLIMQYKFPVLRDAISKYSLQYKTDKIIKEKVNGKLIMDWLDLTEKDGKLVGEIMREVKQLGKIDLLQMTVEEIKDFVKNIQFKSNGK